MFPVFRWLFAVGALLGVSLLTATISAAVCAVRSEPRCLTDNGLPIGNKSLVAYRSRSDLRVALLCPPPSFSISALAPGHALLLEDIGWGEPNHWLKLP